MADNVTPFRRPPQPKEPDRRQGSLKDPHSQAMLVHALTIASFVIFFVTDGELFDLLALALGFAALAIAASKRNTPPSWAATHHEFALRTVMLGGAVWIASTILGIIPAVGGLAAWGVQIAVLAWAGVRCLMGLLRARERAPMVRPRSLFL
jgi:uncharacterized membrane protein